MKNIGVIIDNIEMWYESQIIRGIKSVAKESDFNLFVFCGMKLKSTNKDEAQSNIIYELINVNKLDGLIILAGTLFDNVNEEEVEKFINPFKKIPIVCIAVPIGTMPSIIFDNKNSMNMILEHLINDHKYREIAYISGPRLNKEAQIRYGVYKDALKKHNIPFKEDYVFEGDYYENSGMKAIEYFLEEKKINPQVIVAASDEMAIGALLKMQKLGISVPEEIAITGFDNIEKAKIFTPSITTIKQPIFEMGCMSVKILDKIIKGEEVKRITNISGELIIRESCGCFRITTVEENVHYSVKAIETQDTSDYFFKLKNILNNKKNVIAKYISEMDMPEKDSSIVKTDLDKLFNYYEDDIRNRVVEGEFLKTLKSFIISSITIREQEIPWNKILHYFEEAMIESNADYDLLYLSQKILTLSNILVDDIYYRRDMIHKFYFEKMYLKSRNILQDFTSIFSIEEMKKVVSKAMMENDIKNFSLCLYNSPFKYEIDKEISLPLSAVLTIGSNGESEMENITFDVKELLPKEIIKKDTRNDFIFYPLFYGNDHFGYFVYDSNARDRHIYETLRKQISIALRSLMLLEERKEAEGKLSQAIKELERYNDKLHILSDHDELTKLYNRRGFYYYGQKQYERDLNNNGSFILFYADLDGLKGINDTFGHDSGDEAIKKVAELIKISLRESDILARLGGDEFTIMAVNSSENEINNILSRIKSNFDYYNLNSNKPYKISLSIGYSIFNSNQNKSFHALLKEADAMLYKEKKLKKSIESLS